MKRSILFLLLLAAAAILGGISYVSAEPGGVPYPADYRKWAHVKSTLVGPQSESFARNGGLHHYYANAKAMEGLGAGRFPDGSVLVDDLLQTVETAGVSSEGKRSRLAVMMKDSQRYRETGGWGFEVFAGDKQEGTLTTETRAACFACHGKRKDRDLVFSEFRK